MIIKKSKNINKFINESVEAGNLAVCIRVTGQARMLAPVDIGNLKSSINYKVIDKDGYVGSPLDYSVYQEFGTRKMRAQPYLRPAAKLEGSGARGTKTLAEASDLVARKNFKRMS